MTTEVAPPLAAGRLKLREILGEGGVGTVYLAYDERLDVERAVKVLSRDRASNQVQRQRFLTEARIQARLRHPNIVEVYDIEDDGNQVYLVMELVLGGSLWDRLKVGGPLPPGEATRAVVGILNALEQAHALDIVHRDIKPHNILITDGGVPKLADFGVAHLPSEEHGGVTRTGVVMGTWSFMAPEQRASSRRVDPRSDVYAVAATLYTLVTGYTEPDLFDFELDSSIMQRLPEPLRPVVHRATRYARSQRYPDAVTLREDLERCLPALEDSEAAPWPTVALTEAPDAAHHVGMAGRAPVATTHDRPWGAGEDPDKEARSGTLVPSPAEVDRLLATPPSRGAGVTCSDDGHTVELQHQGYARPGEDTAEGPVALPIDGDSDAGHSDGAGPANWTIDDERQLTEEVARVDDDEPVHATWRSAGRIRFLLFLLVLAVGSAAVVAYQQGWIVTPSGPADVEPVPADPAAVDPAPAGAQNVPASDPGALQAQPAAPPVSTSPPASLPAADPASDPAATDPQPAGDPGVDPEPVGDPESAADPEPAADPGPTTDPEPVVPSFPGLDPETSAPGDVHRRVTMLNEQDVWDCYHEALLTNSQLEGRLEMHWGVSEGQVYSPKPLNTPKGHQDIGSCVATAAAGWQYPSWFTSLPRIHAWDLSPATQTGRLLDGVRGELTRCGDGLTPEEIESFGRGRLDVEIEDGWVRTARVVQGFEHEGLQKCLVDIALGWRLPPYGRGYHYFNLALAVVPVG